MRARFLVRSGVLLMLTVVCSRMKGGGGLVDGVQRIGGGFVFGRQRARRCDVRGLTNANVTCVSKTMWQHDGNGEAQRILYTI